MRNGILLHAAAIVAIVVAQPVAAVQAQTTPTTSGTASEPRVEVVQVTADVYMIGGAGGNVTVQVGPQGLFVVDAGAEATSALMVAAIRGISDRPIRYLANTSADADHVGGNVTVRALGQGIRTRENQEEGAVIIAHEAVLSRMSAPTGQVPPTPVAAWPTIDLLRRAAGPGLQRSGYPAVPRARGAHRRRHGRVLPLAPMSSRPATSSTRRGIPSSTSPGAEASMERLTRSTGCSTCSCPERRKRAGRWSCRARTRLRRERSHGIPRHAHHRARPREGDGREGR